MKVEEILTKLKIAVDDLDNLKRAVNAQRQYNQQLLLEALEEYGSVSFLPDAADEDFVERLISSGARVHYEKDLVPRVGAIESVSCHIDEDTSTDEVKVMVLNLDEEPFESHEVSYFDVLDNEVLLQFVLDNAGK